MPYKDKNDPRQREAWKRWHQRNKGNIVQRTREFRHRNKRFVDRYKSFCGCKLCGEKEPVVLDCHHVKDKDIAIANGIRRQWSIKRLKDELRKCVILCANCHRRVHAGLASLTN